VPSQHPAVHYGTDLAVSYEPGRQLSAAARSTWQTAVGPFLPAVGTVVDVGSGTGRFARLIAQSPRLSVIAIEPSAEMRRIGREAMGDQPLAWLAGTAEHLPLASASADVVWTAFTAHYLDLGSTGREFRRVLRGDGCVLVWHAFPEVFDELEWYRWFPSARTIDEGRIPTLEQVIASFDAAGLELVDRSTHRMRIAEDLHELADRLAHRAISTLRLISDNEFEQGLAELRRFADSASPRPIFSPNILATFRVR
jgi:ubiquinone/menaquinone biosynthesis C-methylase UbiE